MSQIIEIKVPEIGDYKEVPVIELAHLTPEQKKVVGEAAVAAANEIPIELIHANPDQPRRAFREPELTELADSIREKGVLQPVLLLGLLHSTLVLSPRAAAQTSEEVARLVTRQFLYGAAAR